MTERPGNVIVGRVGKPFGTGGDVFVFADPDLEDAIDEGAVLHADDGRTLTVRRAHPHRGRLVVTFDGVVGREGAEGIRGLVLSRPREDVALGEDMVWVADLQGREVVDADGGLVGVVEAIRDGHAHDYMVIARPDGGSATIPMVEELVDWSVDPIVITPPAGLLDPDEAW